MFIDKAIEGNTNIEHVRDNSFGNRNLFNYKNEEENIIQYVNNSYNLHRPQRNFSEGIEKRQQEKVEILG